MKRLEPPVTSPFAKDATQERFLEVLNEILAPHEHQGYQELSETWPTLHIIGAPRTGTTLLSQTIASCLNVGYIDNLIAAFWRAPTFGIRLSQKLFKDEFSSDFGSRFGRTQGIREPHEFGYFWCEILGYNELAENGRCEAEIDWEQFRRTVLNMTREFKTSICFKSFLLCWHLQEVVRVMPKSIFLWMRRDPLETALSILKMRRELLGDAEKWASLKPAEYEWLKNEPYWTQIAGQIFFIEQTISTALPGLEDNFLVIHYDSFCSNPLETLEAIRQRGEQFGSDIAWRETIPDLEIKPQIGAAKTSLEEKQLLSDALKKFQERS